MTVTATLLPHLRGSSCYAYLGGQDYKRFLTGKLLGRNEIVKNKEPDEKAQKNETAKRSEIKELANKIADKNDEALRKLADS